ncbi:metalloregulator ArsR/SmtB family transcription factor [Rhodobacteraceae bacterium 2CG4]|uniref:Metalloregulator ArsR/SmtB family transcription factor n=1 Tax=Halovulum marinum TaxID=2662447 RepID=A0A6L5YVD1_9RHOB|nr:metalloregulator ArsR/SmtB family transcription factor [Halovulum marinum]MSU88010.1 metalloregulator ArsR/SmtB family transcription factor [Halovulum marinum]
MLDTVRFDPVQLKSAAALLSSLASEPRLLVLCRLREGEASVGELAEQCGLSQPAMSQQLKRLRDAGLVGTRRKGQTILHGLASLEAEAVLDVLYSLYCQKR